MHFGLFLEAANRIAGNIEIAIGLDVNPLAFTAEIPHLHVDQLQTGAIWAHLQEGLAGHAEILFPRLILILDLHM